MKEIAVLIRPHYPERMKQQSFPLGLLYLGSILENHHYKVKLFDLNAIGCTNSEIIKYIPRKNVKFIGVSSLSYDFYGMIELCNLIKANNEIKNIPLIIGGVHASSLPQFSLEKTKADVVVIGEGEETIIDLLDAIDNKKNLLDVKGIGFIKDTVFHQTEARPLIKNLDSIPFPAWHL
jgi:anaerobic magnesium-protoporphyrin IX monomethyl ester cyclase